jgi:hypothetical protein
VRALRPHYCRLRWLVRRVELRAASPGFAPCDWHFASSSIALRCSISALVAQLLRATSSARTAGHRVRMSELKIRCGFRRQISSVLSTDGRTGAPVGSAAWLGVESIGQICVFPGLPRPNFREDQGARDCYKYLILVVTPAGVSPISVINGLGCQRGIRARIDAKGVSGSLSKGG